MYTRAREKHARAIQREHRQDVHEEQVDELPKSNSFNAKVRVRRINDETTQKFDDEKIEMGVGLNSKKNQKDKDKDKKSNTKEDDFSRSMPIASEKKRQAEEMRIERIQRLCEKRTVGEILNIAKQAYYTRQEKRKLFKDYIEKNET